MYFRYFLIVSPWKRVWSFIWTNLNPYHPRMLCDKLKLVKIGPVVLEKKSKIGKNYRQTDGQMDRQTTDAGDEKSSLELSAQVSLKLKLKFPQVTLQKRTLLYNFKWCNIIAKIYMINTEFRFNLFFFNFPFTFLYLLHYKQTI